MTALFYSLIESAKLAGVEPRAYLAEAARRAIRNPGIVTLTCDFKYPESLRYGPSEPDGEKMARTYC
ncbi:MAG: transposase domain-containing protein [Myxococcales bacterium]|nr:transposase domain-containing protein [Myxococcales bacterium]